MSRWTAPFLAMALMLPLTARAADCGKVSACDAASLPFSGTELMYIVQNGRSKQTAIGNFASFIGGGMTTNASNALLPAARNNLGLGAGNSPQFTGLTLTGSFTATGLVTNADLTGSIAASKLIGTDIATVGTLTAGSINWAGAITSGVGSVTDTQPYASGAISARTAGLAVSSNKANVNATPGWIWSAVNFNAPPAATPNPWYDGIRSVVWNPGADHTIAAVGISSYLYSKNNGDVGFVGEVVADANNVSLWGFNVLMADNPGNATPGTGRALFNELDFYARSTSTIINGLIFGGASTAQPTTAHAIVLNALDGYPGTGAIKWTDFLFSNDGYTNQFATIGAQAISYAGNPTNSPSQIITFRSFDGGAVLHRTNLQMLANQTFVTNLFDGGTWQVQIAGTAALQANASNVAFNKSTIWSNGALPLHPVYTFGTLPTPSQGARAIITDSTTNTFNAAVAGTGAFVVPVWYDGVNWRVGY